MSKIKDCILIVGTGLIKELMLKNLPSSFFEANKKEYQIVTCDKKYIIENPNSLNDFALIVLCGKPSDSIEIVNLIPADVPVLDMSPTFRDEWVYGINTNVVKGELRVSNPGCFATAVIYALDPLVDRYLGNEPLYIDAAGGRSVGGKRFITKRFNGELEQEAVYSLGNEYVHIKEIIKTTSFTGKLWMKPKIVAEVYSGTRIMFVVPNVSKDALLELYSAHYFEHDDVSITFNNNLALAKWQGKEGININVIQEGEDCLVSASLDNLKKGSVSTAIANIHAMLGL